MAEVTGRLRTLNISARQLSEMTGWNDSMINEWLNIFRNTAIVASETDSTSEQVEQNKANIEINGAAISQNSSDIQSNSDLIQQNTDSISTLNTDIGNHISSDTEHGVAGVNVGTEDYCSAAIGGVVNLSSLVADLVEITTADIGLAPALYDQLYTQSVSDLTNENKLKINEIVLKINDIIAGQIASKQMAAL